MKQNSEVVFERLLRANQLGWLLDIFGPSERCVPLWIANLNEASAEYQSRFGVSVSFTPEVLEAEAGRNPHKIRAFLQAFSAVSSPKMLVMVWRILQGMRIHEIRMTYREHEEFDLTIFLAPRDRDQGPREEYHSNNIQDASLLRHFGSGTVMDQPVFHGFYSLRLWDKPLTPETAAAHSP